MTCFLVGTVSKILMIFVHEYVLPFPASIDFDFLTTYVAIERQLLGFVL